MTNRLAQSQSLYLKKHAENPIDWWPWCPEALATAQGTDRPIFLSIGYSSCHWCTVMEGEAFSDRTIADYLNANFLPIKVDREERPDIDSIYMQALQLLTGQGGWPLNIFLTPDRLIPFYGGTYFPQEPRYGRPGFLQVLQSLRRFYDQDKEKLEQFTGAMLQELHQFAHLPPASPEISLFEHLIQGIQTSRKILARRDPDPRFPMIPYAHLVSLGEALIPEPESLAQARGEALVLGGIYDHVAGGFHRYTVDPSWTVPHFEKMLYDNGQILEFLADRRCLGDGDPAIDRAVRGTVAWLEREMIAPEGYFYAAQDADNFASPTAAEPEEGDFYVWSYGDLRNHFSATELDRLSQIFTLTTNGNFEGKNVLQRYEGGTLDGDIETLVNRLFKLRYGQDCSLPFPLARNNQEAREKTWSGRIPPVTDTKMILAWNALMISGLARIARVWCWDRPFALAKKAADFLLCHQIQGDNVYRLNYAGEVTLPAQGEDYALWIKALLDLHQTEPQDDFYLSQAMAMQRIFDQHLGAEDGGYFNSDPRSPDLLIQERGFADHATPSPNGIALGNLVRLALLTGEASYQKKAEQLQQVFYHALQQHRHSCPSLFTGLAWLWGGTVVKVHPSLWFDLAAEPAPLVVYQITEDLPPGAIALVCVGQRCLEPARSLAMLEEQLRTRWSPA